MSCYFVLPIVLTFSGLNLFPKFYLEIISSSTVITTIGKIKKFQSTKDSSIGMGDCRQADSQSTIYYRTSTQPFLMAVTTACVRSFTFIFCKMLETWFFTVFSEMNKVSPIVRFDCPSVNN